MDEAVVTTAAADQEKIGHFYVVVKHDWKGRTFFAKRKDAQGHAIQMAQKGYDSEVVQVLSRHEAVYQVESKTLD